MLWHPPTTPLPPPYPLNSIKFRGERVRTSINCPFLGLYRPNNDSHPTPPQCPLNRYIYVTHTPPPFNLSPPYGKQQQWWQPFFPTGIDIYIYLITVTFSPGYWGLDNAVTPQSIFFTSKTPPVSRERIKIGKRPRVVSFLDHLKQ